MAAEKPRRSVAIRPVPWNRFGRFKEDWKIVGVVDSRAGTVAEWRAFCASNGFSLRIERPPLLPWDPIDEAGQTWPQWIPAHWRSARKAGGAVAPKAEAAEIVFRSFQLAGPWPERLGGRRGALAQAVRALRARGIQDDDAASVIAEALGRLRAEKGPAAPPMVFWDTCGACGKSFRHRRFSRALLRGMLRRGFAARCASCERAVRHAP